MLERHEGTHCSFFVQPFVLEYNLKCILFSVAKKQKKHLAVLTGDRINEVFLEEKFSRFARRPIESGCEVTVFIMR